MYKIGSCTEELSLNMEKALLANQTEKKYSFNKLAKAVDYLNLAADIFEKAGLTKEAEAIVSILQDIK